MVAETATGTAAGTQAGPAAASGLRTRSLPGRAALAALCVTYALLAALPAASGSSLVGARAGGSPDWLLGPLRIFGASGISGPLFYAGLWVALLLYVLVLVRVGDIPRRAAIWTVVGLHVLFLLAPPLLSQDVFSYIAYARLGVEHGLSPYTHSPVDIPHDAVFAFAGSKDAVSVYGPAFTLLTYPLSPLGVPAAYWILQVVAAAASLGVVAACVVLIAAGLIGFGTGVFDSLGLLSSNQGRSSRLSLPYKVSELVGNRDLVRLVCGMAFAAVAAWTLWRTWRGADAIRMAGWATLAILLASAWLVPWYLLWLLPLAALAADRWLTVATVVLSGWVLAIGVPGIY